MKNVKYLVPTPKGAYYLTQDSVESWQKEVLKNLFSLPCSPQVNNQSLQELFNIHIRTKEDQILLHNKVSEFQKLKYLKIVDNPIEAPTENFENNLNHLFKELLKDNKIILSDSHGFCIANNGFPAEMGDEISVLSADIAIMHKRRAIEINKKLGLRSQAWSIVDETGTSCLGFWPLIINQETFVITIEGIPFFDKPSIVSLVWILYLHYGNK